MKFHLKLAKTYWESLVKPGDTVIDATLGNGHDTLFLAHLLKGKGRLSCYDVQKEALESAEKRLQELSFEERAVITFHHSSHESFLEPSATLIVYNLGYLPGGDKRITTKKETTLKSIESALQIATHAISITCYPGHEEGLQEEKAIFEFLSTLSSQHWEVVYHKHLNRELAPSLIWITRVP